MKLPDHIPNDQQSAVLALANRMGSEEFLRRLGMEHRLRSLRGEGQGKGLFRYEHCYDIYGMIRVCIKASGLWARAIRNYLDIKVVTNEVSLIKLPTALDGYTILQLTDLHADLHPDFADRVIEVIADLEYDLIVVTGDFRTCTYGDHTGATEKSIEILQHAKAPVYATLGNHDFLMKVPPLEAAGVRFLLNEHVVIERDGASFDLIGIDDPSFYATHNFLHAMKGVHDDSCKILLSHSPETATDAEARGIDLLLAGHTHGGQICLPGGIPVKLDKAVTRAQAAGVWREGGLQGYTSRGTGATGLPARFNCPAEVTLHRLRSKDD
ncbi:MAG: metallophosphoesterase [Coraliomargarita sp.]